MIRRSTQEQLNCGTVPHHRRHSYLRRLQHCFWLAGGLAAGWFILASLGVISFQVTQAKRLETLPQNYGPTRSLQSGNSFGKILIPRIGLSAIIAEGDDENTLRHAVGHIPGTAAPWGAGNVTLAGYRDTFSRGLSRVRLDDVILLQTPRGTYRYHVVRITVYDSRRIEMLRSSEWDLTLVTCDPSCVGGGSQRYIVQGTRLPTR